MEKENRFWCVWLIILAVLLSAGWGVAHAEEGYKIIETAELKKWISSENRPLLVNTLSPLQFANERIEGSTCIPMELVENYCGMPEDLNTPIVFYCLGPG